MLAISSKTKTPNKPMRRHRSYTKSSSFIMALLFTILCGGVALILGYFINYFAKGHFVHSTESVLASEFKYIESLETIPSTTSSMNRFYLPLNPKGGLPDNFPRPTERLTEGVLVFDFEKASGNKRFGAKIYTLKDDRKVLIGIEITQISKDFDFMQWLGVASIIFVMLVVFVSYMISIFVVSGTNKIADTARHIIKTGDLSQRLTVASGWDDLSRMASVLNLLLDRIEELIEGTREVSDNIAHDLRTPLTRMRSHIEALQKEDPDNEDYDSLLVEADHILSTFNALLRISRIETEQKRSQFRELELHRVLDDVIDFYAPLAEEKSITLTTNIEHIHYTGDRDLLFQAFANIMDNALKFAPENGTITLELTSNNEQIIITVQDTGSGVPESDKEKIFTRFHRAEKSRSLPGTGLGLSLVLAVISLHGGQIRAENTDSGFRIITIL